MRSFGLGISGPHLAFWSEDSETLTVFRDFEEKKAQPPAAIPDKSRRKMTEDNLMIKSAVTSLLVLVSLFLHCVGAPAAEFGTAQEARAMLERAMLVLKRDQNVAFAQFNRGEDGFRDRDLYVFCFDTMTGIRHAHAVKELIGKDVRLTNEKDGSPLGQKVYDAASSVKEGEITSVSYNFPRPGSTEPVPKESFIARLGNTGCGVGYYK
jgi:cytochrome c